VWLSLEHLHNKQEALSSKPQDHQKKRGGERHEREKGDYLGKERGPVRGWGDGGQWGVE
jgi:hypothetical protein